MKAQLGKFFGWGEKILIFDTSGLQEVAANYPPLIRPAPKIPAIGVLICHNYPAMSSALVAIQRIVDSSQDGCTGGTILREDRHAK